MSTLARVALPLVLAVLPSLAGAQRRPYPRTGLDTVDRRPEPRGVPCSVSCTPVERETWYQFDSRVDVGVGGGAARIETGAPAILTIPVVGADGAWTRTLRNWSLGSSVHGWLMPNADGASGWGGSAMARVARALFDGGPEVRLGGGIGFDRINYTPTAATTPSPTPWAPRQDHFGLAYEAGLAQEFMRSPTFGLLLSAGVVGLQTDGEFPRSPGPMIVAGLGLRWHSWSATQNQTRSRYPRNGPRWPRPIP
jgi:hypothetical protein